MRIWKKFKKIKTNRSRVEYKNYCKNYQKEIEVTKAKYEERKFKERDHKAEQFFNYIRNSTKIHENIAPLNVSGNTVETDQEKCEALSNHYKSVYTHDNNFFPPCQQYMPENSFTNVEIEERDVVNAFK